MRKVANSGLRRTKNTGEELVTKRCVNCRNLLDYRTLYVCTLKQKELYSPLDQTCPDWDRDKEGERVEKKTW